MLPTSAIPSIFTYVALLIALLTAVPTALLSIKQGDSATADLPPPLTIDTFDSTIKKELHFVEFFSPYCSHCKELLPTWLKTYQTFAPEMKELGIYMHQVNCVESGDLCQRESIRYYPLLRLYEGDGEKGSLKSSYPSKYKRNQDQFLRFMRDQLRLASAGSVDHLVPHRSMQLSTPQVLSMIGGEAVNESPILVSFWPTTDDQLTVENFDTLFDTNKAIKDYFLKDCPECFSLKMNWGPISQKLFDMTPDTSMRSGFVNCKSNAKLCIQLGLESLTTPGDYNKDKYPALKLIIPKTGQIIDYKFDVSDYKDVVSWCEKLMEIHGIPEVTYEQLKQKMDLKTNLQNRPGSDLQPMNRVVFVYYYDQETLVPEDFEILPYLTLHMMDIPFDLLLYKSSDSNIKTLLEKQLRSIYRFVYPGKEETLKYEYTEEVELLNSITSMPTLLCFKDGSLINTKFINFEPRGVRNVDALKAFISDNSIPFLQELSSETYPYLFPKPKVVTASSSAISAAEDLVVVTVVDTSKFSEFMDYQLKMSVQQHEAHIWQQHHFYDTVSAQRKDKLDKIEKLRKDKKSTSEDIIDIMRLKVPHTKSQVIYTYIDIKNVPLIKAKGWNIDGRSDYEVGDSIIISRYGHTYWDTNARETNKLHIEESVTAIDAISSKKLKGKLIHSPFSSTFRFMDSVHSHGVWGYLVLITVALTLTTLLRRLRQRRRYRIKYEQRNKNLGILGRPYLVPKSD